MAKAGKDAGPIARSSKKRKQHNGQHSELDDPEREGLVSFSLNVHPSVGYIMSFNITANIFMFRKQRQAMPKVT